MSKLGVIAGDGHLPLRLASHAQSTGRSVFLLRLKGFADPACEAFDGAEAAMGEVGRGVRLLKEAGCSEVVFAGGVKRPDFSTLKLDLQGMALLPDLLAAAVKGDDALLRVVLGAFERAGFKIVGAEEVFGGLLAPQGALGSRRPSERDWIDIRLGAAAALQVGFEDVGQGAIARGGDVIETEQQDGTDAMLARVAPEAPARRGVLVKRPKPMQERRIDLPTIGLTTVRGAAAAGLAGIAVEAEGALIVDREDVASLASELGLFVYGFTPAEVA